MNGLSDVAVGVDLSLGLGEPLVVTLEVFRPLVGRDPGPWLIRRTEFFLFLFFLLHFPTHGFQNNEHLQITVMRYRSSVIASS